MDTEFKTLVSIRDSIEQLIIKKIKKLEWYDEACICKNPIDFFVARDNSAIGYCLKCGGDRDI